MADMKKISFGDNIMEASYSGLKGWYEKSAAKGGAKGFFERTGKAIIVITAHLIAGTVQTVLFAIYDLALTLIFGLAALFTGFKKKSINRQLLGHIGSLACLPEKALKHLSAALCPPFSYKSEHIREMQYRFQFEKYWSKEMPRLAWDAHRNGYFIDHFAERYTGEKESQKKINLSTVHQDVVKLLHKDLTRAHAWDKLEKVRKRDRSISKIPFGSNLMTASRSAFKSWYESSADTHGAKGRAERAGKTLALIPAHLLVGTLQTVAMAIYDLIMGVVFAIAALFTGFKKYAINAQVLGHFGSLIQLPIQAVKNILTALAPPLAYKSSNIRELQYRYQFPHVWTQQAPQDFWEAYRAHHITASSGVAELLRISVINRVLSNSSFLPIMQKEWLKEFNRFGGIAGEVQRTLNQNADLAKAAAELADNLELNLQPRFTNENVREIADALGAPLTTNFRSNEKIVKYIVASGALLKKHHPDIYNKVVSHLPETDRKRAIMTAIESKVLTIESAASEPLRASSEPLLGRVQPASLILEEEVVVQITEISQDSRRTSVPVSALNSLYSNSLSGSPAVITASR